MELKRVAVIGADPISVSIALALKALKDPPEIEGYDTSGLLADLARTRGAFDKVSHRPERTVKDADLVLLSLPLTVMREALEVIAPALRPGCVVTDTACLKAPVVSWAAELLPAEAHFIGGHVILSPSAAKMEPHTDLEEAGPSLLRGALYCLTPAPGTDGSVIDELAELVQELGAQPFFIDVTEHDGMQAGIEQLPHLLTVALLLSIVDTPGWQEMRKFAGHHFARATDVGETPFESQAAIILNRENLVLRLNGLLTELMHVRDLLTKGDAEALEQLFAASATGRESWLADRAHGMWGPEGTTNIDDIPTSGERIGSLFFGERAMERLRKGDQNRPRRT